MSSVTVVMELTWCRGVYPDSANRMVVAVTRPDGSVLPDPRCDPDRRAFVRSAAKPAQAVGPVLDGTLERFGLDERHLAVACGSHNGSEVHTSLVVEILDAASVPHDALTPGDDGQGGPLQHQCSGNHALVLAWCAANGWPVDGYLQSDHPAQATMDRWVTWWLGVEPERAPDGCGMVAYRVALADSARAFGRLARAAAETVDDMRATFVLPSEHTTTRSDRAEPSSSTGRGGAHRSSVVGDEAEAWVALGRCGAAMAAHPELVRWPGQLDTELMLAAGDEGLVAKCGAEGFWACGTADGWGLALRVLDGAVRAWPPAGMWAVRTLLADVLDSDLATPALDAIADPPVLDGKGATVGGLAVTDAQR